MDGNYRRYPLIPPMGLIIWPLLDTAVARRLANWAMLGRRAPFTTHELSRNTFSALAFTISIFPGCVYQHKTKVFSSGSSFVWVCSSLVMISIGCTNCFMQLRSLRVNTCILFRQKKARTKYSSAVVPQNRTCCISLHNRFNSRSKTSWGFNSWTTTSIIAGYFTMSRRYSSVNLETQLEAQCFSLNCFKASVLNAHTRST